MNMSSMHGINNNMDQYLATSFRKKKLYTGCLEKLMESCRQTKFYKKY